MTEIVPSYLRYRRESESEVSDPRITEMSSRIGREPTEQETQDLLDFMDESGRGFEPTRHEMVRAVWTLMQRAEYEVADRLAARAGGGADDEHGNRLLRLAAEAIRDGRL